MTVTAEIADGLEILLSMLATGRFGEAEINCAIVEMLTHSATNTVLDCSGMREHFVFCEEIPTKVGPTDPG